MSLDWFLRKPASLDAGSSHYAKKVEKYYKGKFSYALDNAIDNALYMSDFCNIKKEVRCCIPDYTMEEMTLYSDRRKETKKRCLKAESK